MHFSKDVTTILNDISLSNCVILTLNNTLSFILIRLPFSS